MILMKIKNIMKNFKKYFYNYCINLYKKNKYFLNIFLFKKYF